MLPEDFKWGVGTKSKDLQVYTSVAVKPGKYPAGQTLYIKKLDGIRLPGAYGQIFNGCVRVEDICCSCADNEIKFFVGTKRYQDQIVKFSQNVTTVSVEAKKCMVFEHKIRPPNQFLNAE